MFQIPMYAFTEFEFCIKFNIALRDVAATDSNW